MTEEEKARWRYTASPAGIEQAIRADLVHEPLLKPPTKRRADGSGNLFRQALSPFWWASYWKDGKRYRESTKCREKRDAEQWLKKRVGQLAEGKPIVSPSRVNFDTLETLIKTDYSNKNRRSWEHVERKIRLHVRPYFARYTPADITTAIIEECKAHRKQQKASGLQINRELAIVSRMFTLALRSELLFKKPHIEKFPESEPKQSKFSEEELALFLLHLPAFLRPAVQFAFWSTYRLVSEVLSLEWRDCDLSTGLRITGQNPHRHGQ